MVAGKWRVGIIGAGTIGKAILTDLLSSDRADVVYVTDSSPGWKAGRNDDGYQMLDTIEDGRDVIETVVVTTSKSGKSLGADEASEGVLFEGATRDVCRLFPRNVNVHAAIALAGIGFDRTTSRVIAVPGQNTMEHRLEVSGNGFSWDIQVSSLSLGGVTGAYTPRSAVGSVRRILGNSGITIA